MLALVEVVQAALVFISSYAESMWVFMVFYGLLFGIVSCMVLMVPVVECNKYFPNHKKITNGFIFIGTGIGPTIFGMFSYNILNPNKVPHNKGYYIGN